ncbi:MAG: hypothetical protein IMX00_11430 [Limnochordales bacterium]|nr:hypothetical protein [Limnochordales bacterium]
MNGKWVPQGPMLHMPLSIAATNLALVGANGEVLAFARDPMVAADQPGSVMNPNDFVLGYYGSQLDFGKSATGTVWFDLPETLRTSVGQQLVVSPETLGHCYIVLMGENGAVYAAWAFDATKVVSTGSK